MTTVWTSVSAMSFLVSETARIHRSSGATSLSLSSKAGWEKMKGLLPMTRTAEFRFMSQSRIPGFGKEKIVRVLPVLGSPTSRIAQAWDGTYWVWDFMVELLSNFFQRRPGDVLILAGTEHDLSVFWAHGTDLVVLALAVFAETPFGVFREVAADDLGDD